MAKRQRLPAPVATSAITRDAAPARRTASRATAAGSPGRCSTASTCTWRCRRFGRATSRMRRPVKTRLRCVRGWSRRARGNSNARAGPTRSSRRARWNGAARRTLLRRSSFATPSRACRFRRGRSTVCSRSRARSRTWPAGRAWARQRLPRRSNTAIRARQPLHKRGAWASGELNRASGLPEINP